MLENLVPTMMIEMPVEVGAFVVCPQLDASSLHGDVLVPALGPCRDLYLSPHPCVSALSAPEEPLLVFSSPRMDICSVFNDTINV